MDQLFQVVLNSTQNKKGCLHLKVTPHNAQVEEHFTASKDSDGDNLQLRPEMTVKDSDTYLRTLFPQLFAHIDAMDHDIQDDDNDSDSGEPSEGSF